MRKIALLLASLILLTGLAGCTEEARQKAESSSDDTRNEISGKVNLLVVYVENTSAEDKVTSALVKAKLASGSENTTMDKISYFSNCQRNGEQVHVEAVHLTGETELKAGDGFEFIAEFSECAAAQDETLDFWAAIDDGGQTLRELEVRSTEKGAGM